jgi:hypothetical protein
MFGATDTPIDLGGGISMGLFFLISGVVMVLGYGQKPYDNAGGMFCESCCCGALPWKSCGCSCEPTLDEDGMPGNNNHFDSDGEQKLICDFPFSSLHASQLRRNCSIHALLLLKCYAIAAQSLSRCCTIAAQSKYSCCAIAAQSLCSCCVIAAQFNYYAVAARSLRNYYAVSAQSLRIRC